MRERERDAALMAVRSAQTWDHAPNPIGSMMVSLSPIASALGNSWNIEDVLSIRMTI